MRRRCWRFGGLDRVVAVIESCLCVWIHDRVFGVRRRVALRFGEITHRARGTSGSHEVSGTWRADSRVVGRSPILLVLCSSLLSFSLLPLHQ